MRGSPVNHARGPPDKSKLVPSLDLINPLKLTWINLVLFVIARSEATRRSRAARFGPSSPGLLRFARNDEPGSTSSHHALASIFQIEPFQWVARDSK